MFSPPSTMERLIEIDDTFVKINYGFESSINNLSKSELKTIDEHTWSISSELDGLQPQRAKLIQPVIYASCFDNSTYTSQQRSLLTLFLNLSPWRLKRLSKWRDVRSDLRN